MPKKSIVLEPFDIRFSVEKLEAEKMVALVGNCAARMSRGMWIVVCQERTAEQGETDLLPIPVEREDVGRYHANRIPVAGHLSPIPQGQFPAVVRADKFSSHNAVGPFLGRCRQGQRELEYLALFLPKNVEKEFGIIRIGMESPFGSKAAFPNPPHLNE